MTPPRPFRRAAIARRALGALALGWGLFPLGCAAPALRVEGITIAKDATFDLLPPSALKQSVSLEQIVDARYGDQSYTFHCLLEVDERRLVLVGMTPFNTRAFTLSLSDEEFTLDMAPGARLPAEPSRILADLQLALWPDAYSVRGLELAWLQSETGTLVREFQRDGTAVIRIAYDERVRRFDKEPWGERLLFQHLEQDYTLDVRTLRAERLSP